MKEDEKEEQKGRAKRKQYEREVDKVYCIHLNISGNREMNNFTFISIISSFASPHNHLSPSIEYNLIREWKMIKKRANLV